MCVTTVTAMTARCAQNWPTSVQRCAGAKKISTRPRAWLLSCSPGSNPRSGRVERRAEHPTNGADGHALRFTASGSRRVRPRTRQPQCNHGATTVQNAQPLRDLAMDVITSWTGARADALRQALRMTNEAFAERLGAAVRTVAYWRERSGSVPQPAMQEALDTLLAQAPELARAQFWLILAERERGQASLQPPLAVASPWAAGGEGTSIVPAHATRLVTPGDLSRVRSMRAHLKAIDN